MSLARALLALASAAAAAAALVPPVAGGGCESSVTWDGTSYRVSSADLFTAGRALGTGIASGCDGATTRVTVYEVVGADPARSIATLAPRALRFDSSAPLSGPGSRDGLAIAFAALGAMVAVIVVWRLAPWITDRRRSRERSRP
jgi:hypothetical protein